jgi:N-acetylneuraminic acid mutarotase
MNNARHSFGACVIMGEIYVTGGLDVNERALMCVEKYSPSINSWTAVADMPAEDKMDAVVICVGSAMYVVGGFDESTLKYDSAHDT